MLALLLGLPIWVCWLIALAFVVSNVCLLAVEWYGSSFSLTTLVLAILVWFDFQSTTPWLTTHAHTLYWAIPLYLSLGVVTAFGKWFLHVLRRVSWIKDAKASFNYVDEKKPNFHEILKRSGYGAEFNSLEEAVIGSNNQWNEARPARQYQAFVKYYSWFAQNEHPGAQIEVYNDVDYSEGDSAVVKAISPRAVRNVGKITIWVYQWPLVVASTLVENVLVKLGKHLAKVLDNLFS